MSSINTSSAAPSETDILVPKSVLSVSATATGASFTVVTLGSCVAVAVELLPSVTVTV